MLRTRLISGLIVVALLAIAVAPAVADDNGNVPKSVIKEMEQKFRLPRRPTTRQELMEMRLKAVRSALDFGKELEVKYPKASNLYEVQRLMLYAADFLAKADPGAETKAQKLAVAKRILDSDAPAKAKVTSDFFVTQEKVAPGGSPAADAEKQIQAYVDRYAKTDSAGLSLVRASQLAEKAKLADLEDKLLDKLEADYSDDPEIGAYLKQKGRSPMIGKPFVAELPLLDGSTLNLPKDRLGKVVVVDFWATWCGPCIRYLPHMKKVYNQYKDKNVEFIGVSLDKAGQKSKLASFVKSRQMPWTHAYSGKFWSDPTAKKYGVRGIPAIWVIGKDGKIFSDNARSNLEETIDKALAQEIKAGK